MASSLICDCILLTCYSKCKFHFLFWVIKDGSHQYGLGLVLKNRRVFLHIHNFSKDFLIITLVNTRMEGGNTTENCNMYFLLQRRKLHKNIPNNEEAHSWFRNQSHLYFVSNLLVFPFFWCLVNQYFFSVQMTWQLSLH